MKVLFRVLAVFMVVLMVTGCGSKRKIVTKKKRAKTEHVSGKPQPNTPSRPITPATRPQVPTTGSNASVNEIYIATYSGIAQQKMREHRIPASITLAQGILESASGRGRLAIEANNHFGIKCHGWSGDKIYHNDDAHQECFRKYRHAEQSFEDHSTFLTSRSRYARLFTLKADDYKGWARELRAAGYATDRKYPEKLISIIERYQLYRYDQEVLGSVASKPAAAGRPGLTHTVVAGDTLYSLSKRYNLTVDQLQRINGMSNNDLQVGQILIIKYN